MGNSIATYSKTNECSVRFRVPWEEQLCIAENDQKLPFRDPLEHKSKVSQKLCCDKLCEVAVLQGLVNGTLERYFTKATHASVDSL